MAGRNVPDFEGLVSAAAGDKLAVGRKNDGIDTVIETSQHMKHTDREEKHGKKTCPREWPVAMAGGNVPDFDGVVVVAAGNKLPSGEKATELTL